MAIESSNDNGPTSLYLYSGEITPVAGGSADIVPTLASSEAVVGSKAEKVAAFFDRGLSDREIGARAADCILDL